MQHTCFRKMTDLLSGHETYYELVSADFLRTADFPSSPEEDLKRLQQQREQDPQPQMTSIESKGRRLLHLPMELEIEKIGCYYVSATFNLKKPPVWLLVTLTGHCLHKCIQTFTRRPHSFPGSSKLQTILLSPPQQDQNFFVGSNYMCTELCVSTFESANNSPLRMIISGAAGTENSYCTAGNFRQEFNFVAFVKAIFWLN